MVRLFVLGSLLLASPFVGFAVGRTLYPDRRTELAPEFRDEAPQQEHHARCTRLREEYVAFEKELPHDCTKDDECLAEPRGELYAELDGCTRITSARGDRTRIDATAARWHDEGCVREIMHCASVSAQCVAGRCTERPPAPIPADWQHVTVARAFSFYLPPEARDEHREGEDTYTNLYRVGAAAFGYDFNPRADAPARVHANDEPIRVDGHPALFSTTGGDDHRAFVVRLVDVARRYHPSREGYRDGGLYFYTSCSAEHPESCEPLLRAIVATVKVH